MLVSELKTKFAERLHEVQDELYKDVVRRGWFTEHPDKVRKRWTARGLMLTVAGGGLVYVLARWTHWGLVAVPVVLGGSRSWSLRAGCRRERRPEPPWSDACEGSGW